METQPIEAESAVVLGREDDEVPFVGGSSPKERVLVGGPDEEVCNEVPGAVSNADPPSSTIATPAMRMSMSSSRRSIGRRRSFVPDRPRNTLVEDKVSSHYLRKALLPILDGPNAEASAHAAAHWIYVADTSRTGKDASKMGELDLNFDFTGDSFKETPPVGVVVPMAKSTSSGYRRPIGITHQSLLSLLSLGGKPHNGPSTVNALSGSSSSARSPQEIFSNDESESITVDKDGEEEADALKEKNYGMLVNRLVLALERQLRETIGMKAARREVIMNHTLNGFDLPATDTLQHSVEKALHQAHDDVEVKKEARRQKKRANRLTLLKQCESAVDGSSRVQSQSVNRRRQVSVVAPGEEDPRQSPTPLDLAEATFETPGTVPVLESDDSLMDSASSTPSDAEDYATNGSRPPVGIDQPTLKHFLGDSPKIPLGDSTVELCMDAIIDEFRRDVELSQARKRYTRRWRLEKFQKLLVESERVEKKLRDGVSGQTVMTIVDRSNQAARKAAKTNKNVSTKATPQHHIPETKKRLVVDAKTGHECSDSLSCTSSELSEDDYLFLEHPLFCRTLSADGMLGPAAARRRSSIDDALGTFESGNGDDRIPSEDLIVKLHATRKLSRVPRLCGASSLLVDGESGTWRPLLPTTDFVDNSRHAELSKLLETSNIEVAKLIHDTYTDWGITNEGDPKRTVMSEKPPGLLDETCGPPWPATTVISIADMEHLTSFIRTTVLKREDAPPPDDIHRPDEAASYFARPATVLREALPVKRSFLDFSDECSRNAPPIVFKDILRSVLGEENEDDIASDDLKTQDLRVVVDVTETTEGKGCETVVGGHSTAPSIDVGIVQIGQIPLDVSEQLRLLLPTTTDDALCVPKVIAAQLDKVMKAGPGLPTAKWSGQLTARRRELLSRVNAVFPSAAATWLRASDPQLKRYCPNTRLEGKRLRRRLQLQRENTAKKFLTKAQGATSNTTTAKQDSTRIAHLLQMMTDHLANSAEVDNTQIEEVSGVVLPPPTKKPAAATPLPKMKRRSTTTATTTSAAGGQAPPTDSKGFMYMPSFRGSLRDIARYVDAVDILAHDDSDKTKNPLDDENGVFSLSSTFGSMRFKLSSSEARLHLNRIQELAGNKQTIPTPRPATHNNDYRSTEHLYVLPEDILRPLVEAVQGGPPRPLDSIVGGHTDDLEESALIHLQGDSNEWDPNAPSEKIDEAIALTRDQVVADRAPATVVFNSALTDLQTLVDEVKAHDAEHEREQHRKANQRQLEALQLILGAVEKSEEDERVILERDLAREFGGLMDQAAKEFAEGKRHLRHASVHEKLKRAKQVMASALGTGFGSTQQGDGDAFVALVKSAQQQAIGGRKIIDEMTSSSSSASEEENRERHSVGSAGKASTSSRSSNNRRKAGSATHNDRQVSSSAKLIRVRIGNRRTRQLSNADLEGDAPAVVSPVAIPAPGQTRTLITFSAFVLESDPKASNWANRDGCANAAVFAQMDDITLEYGAPAPLEHNYPTDACLLEESKTFLHSDVAEPPIGSLGLSLFRPPLDAIPMTTLGAFGEELDGLLAEVDFAMGRTPPNTPREGLPVAPRKRSPSGPASAEERRSLTGTSAMEAAGFIPKPSLGSSEMSRELLPADNPPVQGPPDPSHLNGSFVAFADSGKFGLGPARHSLSGSLLSVRSGEDLGADADTQRQRPSAPVVDSDGTSQETSSRELDRGASMGASQMSLSLLDSLHRKISATRHKSLHTIRRDRAREQQEIEEANRLREAEDARRKADELATQERELLEAGLAFTSQPSFAGMSPTHDRTVTKATSMRRATVRFELDSPLPSDTRGVLQDEATSAASPYAVEPGKVARQSVYGLPLDLPPRGTPSASVGPLSSVAAAMAGTSNSSEQLRRDMLAAREAKERAAAQKLVDEAAERERCAEETHGFLRSLLGTNTVHGTPQQGPLLGSDPADDDITRLSRRANRRYLESTGEQPGNGSTTGPVLKSSRARNRTASMEKAADELRDELTARHVVKEFPSQRMIQHHLRFLPLGGTVVALMRPTESVVMGALAAKRDALKGSKLHWKPPTRLVDAATPVVIKVAISAPHVAAEGTIRTRGPSLQYSLVHAESRPQHQNPSSPQHMESPLFVLSNPVAQKTRESGRHNNKGDEIVEELLQVLAEALRTQQQSGHDEAHTGNLQRRALGGDRPTTPVDDHVVGYYCESDVLHHGPYSPHFLPSPISSWATRTSSANPESVRRDINKVAMARRQPRAVPDRSPLEPELRTERQLHTSMKSQPVAALDASKTRMGREQAKRMFVAHAANPRRRLLAPISHGDTSGRHPLDIPLAINGVSRAPTPSSLLLPQRKLPILSPATKLTRPAVREAHTTPVSKNSIYNQTPPPWDSSLICKSYQQQHTSSVSNCHPSPSRAGTPPFLTTLATPPSSATIIPSTASTQQQDRCSHNPHHSLATLHRSLAASQVERVVGLQQEIAAILHGIRWEALRAS